MTAELTELNAVAAELPPELVRKVIDYATLLKQWAEKPAPQDVGWTDEDYRETTAASMRYYDQLYPEDEGYGDPAPAR
jgi:hypothetical protein